MTTITTTYLAPDIECDGCANAIKRALSKVSGISDASDIAVDIDAKRVTVHHAAPATEQAVLDALDKAGFPAQIVAG